MKFLTAIMFEFTPKCNLGSSHPWCPHNADRWAGKDTTRSLDDSSILDLAVKFTEEHGFRGVFGWHYYNEPLFEAGRLFDLVRLIHRRVPSARFVLWSNGSLMRPYMAGPLKLFEQVIVSDYDKRGEELKAICPHVELVYPSPDARIDDHEEPWPGQSTRPCPRPFTEFCIDYHGYAHVCCNDWRGKSSPGNVLTDPLHEVVDRWQRMRDRIITSTVMGDMPVACRCCGVRDPLLQTWDENIASECITYSREVYDRLVGV
ncbi:MAG: hypothetical protein M0R22_04465 [Dehalococcoidia bacterium]|jgi:hypothetical protein|nr:hypothetical protein [Dehalococcoidia bacterium]